MARNIAELREAMPREARAGAAQRAAEALAAMPPSLLRMARGLTEQEIGHILATKVREDVHLSSLRRYVSALGGELEVTARFPDCAIRVDVEA